MTTATRYKVDNTLRA